MTHLPLSRGEVIDSATLAAKGSHSHDVEHLCRGGRLHRLVKGWFATRLPETLADRHDLMMRALVRHFDGPAAAKHSRLVTLKLPTWKAYLAVGHLVRVSDRGCRTRGGYRVHPAVVAAPLVTTDYGPAGRHRVRRSHQVPDSPQSENPCEPGTPERNPLFDEKRREDAIRDEVSEFVRLTWPQLDDVSGIGRRIAAARFCVGRRVA